MKPYATYTLIAITFLVQLLQFTPAGLSCLYLHPYTSPQFGPWQFVTYLFAHAPIHNATTAMHLLFNMQLLWVFGPAVERHLGHVLFTASYLITGITAVVITTLLLPAGLSAPVTGASAAVYGLLALFALYQPHKRIRILFTPFTFTAGTMAALLIVANLVLAVFWPAFIPAAMLHIIGALLPFIFLLIL